MRALVSVYEKEGLDELARGLAELGVELVASGGTAAALEGLGLPVTRVEAITDFPELLGGRVKTLHPRIHAGILARRELANDADALAAHGIEPFDLVVVNLYPFERAASQPDASEAEAIELIDIGGPALLRAAAKNHAHVAAVCRPQDYGRVLAELREHGGVSAETRRELAATAFAATAAYDAAIAAWFRRGGGDFPETYAPAFERRLELAYGENPHQRAAYYAERGAAAHLLGGVEQLHGRALSFNNLHDLNAARLLSRELPAPSCVIVKHANPCGAALGATTEEAYERALASDPLSAYGGVVALDRPVSAELGAQLAEQFVEVLLAPGYELAALEALTRRQAIRILDSGCGAELDADELDLKRVVGGLLVQERDHEVAEREHLDVATGDLGEEEWADLLFAWRVCKHVSSNAIVLAKGLRTIGIGAGQMSRVDAVRIAVEKAREHGHALEGAALASDAFFPFADGPRVALEAGVAALVQPGGSKRDEEVVAAVAEAGAAMVFTGRRHFRH